MAQKLASDTDRGTGTLRRDIGRYGAAIASATVFSAVQVFVIPRRLDVETYGQYRLFLLFVNYFGLIQFGLSEGGFLRWAGRPRGQIAWEWQQVTRWIFLIHAPVIILAVIGAVAFPGVRVFLIAICICALFVNLAAVCGFALQAAGDFKHAGNVAMLAPGLFIAGFLLLPQPTLTAILAVYTASFAVAWGFGWIALRRITPDPESGPDALSVKLVMRSGLPVMGASIAAVLSQSVDRFFVSAAVPLTAFALYGFASTAAVAANSATQTLQRVALSHAAHKTVDDRSRFLGGFLNLIAIGYGTALVFEPLFEHAVASALPLYRDALPIIRAFTVGLPAWVGMRVVLLPTLQSHGKVNRQLACELVGVALVAAIAAVLVLAHRPMWQVAAGGSLASAITFVVCHRLVVRSVPTALEQPVYRFLLIVLLQGAALLAALSFAASWPFQAATYAVLAFLPTGYAVMRMRTQRW